MPRELTIVLGATALLACTSGKPRKDPPIVYEAAPVRDDPVEPQPGPKPALQPAPQPSEPTVCEPSELPLGALEFVRQWPLDMPSHVDPTGRFGADNSPTDWWPIGGSTETLGDCEVWELDSGLYLGVFGQERASGACVHWAPGVEDPCTSWPAIEALELHDPAPVQQVARSDELLVVIEGCAGRAQAGADVRFRFTCPEGAPYLALSLSPDGARFVAARSDALELRSLKTGELIAELSLREPAPPARDLLELGLGWSARGMPVAVSVRGPVCGQDELDLQDCEHERWNEDELIWELRRWDGPEAPVEVTVLNWGEDAPAPAYLSSVAIDPLGLWLFAEGEWGQGHDIPWGRAQVPLTPEAAARPFDVSGEWEEGEDVYTDTKPWVQGVSVSAQGSWLGGARTARVWTITNNFYDGEGSGSDDLHWASFELTPASKRRSGPHELASDYNVEAQSLEVLGVREGAALVAWSHCWDPDEDPAELADFVDRTDIGPDNCRGHSPVPRGCEARGVSAGLDWLLVTCPQGARLIPVGPAAGALDSVTLSSAKDGPVTAVFGRSGLAIASERGGAKLLRSDGRPRASLPELRALLPATLAEELDRAVARGPAGLALLDLARGEVLARIPSSSLAHAATHLAFAPDASRLAVSDGRQISIFSATTGALERSWDAGAVLGLAWRQDGAVLLSGSTRALPELAWDPARGVLARDQPDPGFVERLALAELDPSWRWAFEGDEVILRVIDGLALHLEEHGVVSETGLHDGGAGALYVRVGGLEPSRVFALERLPARLRHGDLLDDFLAGEPLPRPVLTEAELAQLRGG